MELRQENSPIDGITHSENLLFLQGALLATDLTTLGARCPGIFNGTESYRLVTGTALLPRTTIVADPATRNLLIILNGMQSYDKVAALLAGWSDPNTNQDGLTYPYSTAATALIGSVFTILGGLVWNKVRVVGHSYGGAVAYYLADLVTQTGLPTDIKVYTYGAPKPGVSVPWRPAITANSRRVFITDDPIPTLPSSYDDISGLYIFLGVPTARAWTRWRQPMTGLSFFPNGTLRPQDNPTRVPWPGGYINLTQWLVSGSAFGSDSHSLDAYERACAIVPAAAAPTSAPQTESTGRGHSYVTNVQIETARATALIVSGNQVASDPGGAVRAITANVVIVPGIRYRGKRIQGREYILYGTDVIDIAPTRRVRRAMVRRLNKTLDPL